jgi:hypothetical protein
MVLFYIRLFALQWLMSKNEKSLDMPKILSARWEFESGFKELKHEIGALDEIGKSLLSFQIRLRIS